MRRARRRDFSSHNAYHGVDLVMCFGYYSVHILLSVETERR